MDFIMNIVAKLTVRKTGVDRLIYGCILFLCIFGIVMIGDASVGMSMYSDNENYAVINMVKQVVFVVGGIFVMGLASRRYHRERSNIFRLYIAYTITLVAMFVCLLWTINSSHAWIKIGPITVQPAEFMKVILILLLSTTFGDLSKQLTPRREVSKRTREKQQNRKLVFCIVIPILLVFIAFLVCGIVQRDLGSALIIFAISYMVFLAVPEKAYSRLKRVSIVGILGIVVAVIIMGGLGLASHQLQRVYSWLNPLNEETLYTTSYQIVNGLMAYSRGGLLGVGFGQSVMKYGYIPEAQNDYISAIIVEELGLLGFALIVIPYIIIIIRLVKYAIEMKNSTDKLILIGTASYFFFHLFVNIGGVSGLIPMTGVPLLLISAGGSSTIAALFMIGISQSVISKHNKQLMQEEAENSL